MGAREPTGGSARGGGGRVARLHERVPQPPPRAAAPARAPRTIECEPSGCNSPLGSARHRRPGPVQRRGSGPAEGGGDDLYLNATLSRSLRHVSQRERSGSSQFFSTFLSSPQPRNAPRPAGRGHLRSFFQHLSRQPPRGVLRARGAGGAAGGVGARGGGGVGAGPSAAAGSAGHGAAARRPGAQPGRPPALSSHPRPAPPPPASRRSPSLVRSLSLSLSLECFPSWKRETERQN